MFNRRSKSEIQVDTTAPELSSLAPDYAFEHHGTYFSILKKTIDTQPKVANIALAGTYGTGKSSVLRQLAEAYEGRVVELSLLTLGEQPDATGLPDDSNPAAATTTNRIQKEIVKQLLYQQRPTRAPESRFRRIMRFRWWPELGIAACVSVAAVVIALVAGLDVTLQPSIAVTFADRPQGVPLSFLLLAVALLTGSITLAIRALVRGRVGVEKVTAGPATITLPARSTSFFDEYLDEIIYFFEVNKRRDIVIIEDLDRFDDPHIFEALRSLNGLLNAAQQLDGRNFRFIYAVRDSVFERLGRGATTGIDDEAHAELVRANRTKFFELVVPVVPFITHKNARDLMADLLERRHLVISKDLIDLAARHVADMRLIHNIINEYAVFKHRLLDVATPVPELDPDRLFAMILFKNAHMADFEKIRLGSSSLDRLWSFWRVFVRGNITSIREENRALRASINAEKRAKDYAKAAGKAVRTRFTALANAPGTTLTAAHIRYGGNPVTDDQLQSLEFWQEFKDPGLQVQVSLNYGVRDVSFTRSVLEDLLGLSLAADKFSAEAEEASRQVLEENEEKISLLRRHTWERLCAEPSFRHALEPGEQAKSFQSWTKDLMPSRLAADLVINGYITSYFALHVSSFYGKLIRPDAMTYVMRYIEHGLADMDYPLDSEDVEAILKDQGSTVLGERSMLNVGIFDHLLAARFNDAETAFRSAQSAGDVSVSDFVERYLEVGVEKKLFAACMASVMPDTLVALVSNTTLSPDEQAELVDIAINNRGRGVSFVLVPEVRSLIESRYFCMPSLGATAEQTSARRVVQFLAAVGAVLPDLRGIGPHAVVALRETNAWSITPRNLEVITGSNDISLDAVARSGKASLSHLAARPSDYASALRESATQVSVASAGLLVVYLREAGGESSDAIAEIIAGAASDCVVDDLQRVPVDTWPALVRTQHAVMTAGNAISYLDEYDEVDGDLAAALARVAELGETDELDDEARARVAAAVINSPSDLLGAEHRVQLAASLEPETLPTSQIAPRSGSLVGELISAELIADDEEAFSARLMVDWPTQASTIALSDNFSSFVGPDSLSARYVSGLLRDKQLKKLHYPVVAVLSEYSDLPRDAYEAFAEGAMAGEWKLNFGGVRMALEGGVGERMTLELTAKFIDRLTGDELRSLLRMLNSPWEKIADPGFGLKEVADTPSARVILDRLKTEGVVSKYAPHGTGRLRVSLRQR